MLTRSREITPRSMPHLNSTSSAVTLSLPISGRITFTEPITDRFADLVWGGPPPFDAAVSGAWEIRDDRMHLGDANIDFLNLLVFEDNGSVSINEFGITPNGELSFGAGECLNGEVNGVFQDVLVEYTMTVSVCKGL